MNIEELLKNIPLKTYNCQSFGLRMMPTYQDNATQWEVCYYTNFSKEINDAIPRCVAPTLEEALTKMYNFFKNKNNG